VTRHGCLVTEARGRVDVEGGECPRHVAESAVATPFETDDDLAAGFEDRLVGYEELDVADATSELAHLDYPIAVAGEVFENGQPSDRVDVTPVGRLFGPRTKDAACTTRSARATNSASVR